MSIPGIASPKRVIGLVDGFNLYHAIDDLVKRNDLKWLNIIGLLRAFVSSGEELKKAFFFTALPPWSPEKRARHELLLDVYKDLGVNIIPGEFRLSPGKCRGSCRETFQSYAEKETDINIALAMARIAKDSLCEKVILVTGDSDQVPSIVFAASLNPALRIKVVVPPFRHSKELESVAHERAKISVDHLERHRIPDTYQKRQGGTIVCPGRWRNQDGGTRPHTLISN